MPTMPATVADHGIIADAASAMPGRSAADRALQQRSSGTLGTVKVAMALVGMTSHDTASAVVALAKANAKTFFTRMGKNALTAVIRTKISSMHDLTLVSTCLEQIFMLGICTLH
jgi:hypothetical protein